MARRALIIAIEQYAQMKEGLAPRLNGTHRSALAFRQWLIDEQGLDSADIELCAEDPEVPDRTAGATRQDVKDALVRLRDAGRNMTEHFYAYLAGHGFTYTDIDALHLADVLLLQEYQRRDISGDACLKIDSVQSWLRRALGPGEHFYFVDCCRNPVSQREIQCTELGVAYGALSNGDPTIHTLYSTIEGAVAAVGSGFCRVLISGLNGTGRAKVWLEDDRGMAVKFLPVSRFVAQKLPGQPVDPDTWGQGEGLIREFIPAPCYELKVMVEDADPGDSFTVNASTTRGQQLAPTTFSGPEWTSTTWPPDSYNVTLSAAGYEVEPLDPGPADLYDDCRLRFRKGPPPTGPPLPPPAPPPPRLTVRAPDGASLRILGLSRPEAIERDIEFAEPLTPDSYRVEVLDNRGVPVADHEIVLEPNQWEEIDLRGFVESPLREALLLRLPHGGGAIDFSETLGGPTPDQGLDLWLATIGAARILQGAPDDFSKLGSLPLASFFDVPTDGGPVYVLAGFDEPPERVTVTLDGVAQGVDAHPELPGLFELSAPGTFAGSHLVTLEVDSLAPITLATASASNRATLVTFSRHAGEAVRVRQLILPVPHLIDAYTHWRNPPLDTVRRSVEVQRQFEGGRELSALLRQDELIDLLYFKWTEAVMCLLGAYELARRGHIDRLREAAFNLQQYFPELPDSHAIARLAGLEAPPPAFPPLVLDGFLGLGEQPPSPPGAELDYRGPWTVWRGGPTARGAPSDAPGTRTGTLTVAERQVAVLAAAGRSNAEIANELFVSKKTVELHLRNIFRKLNINSRDELPTLHLG